MADRLLMVNKGKKVLYGPVAEIRQQFADHALYLSGEGDWAALPFVERMTFDENEHANLVVLRQGMSSDEAFRMLAQQPNLHLNPYHFRHPLHHVYQHDFQLHDAKHRRGKRDPYG